MEALRIFLSHSSQDTVSADAIVRGLRAAGADVWYDEHNLGAGHLKNEIQRELGRRPIFLVLLSKAAFASPWVKKETDWADELAERDPTRLILPVTVAPIERSDFDPEQGWLFLHAFKRIESPGYRPYPVPEAMRRLLQALALTPGGAAVLTSTASKSGENVEDLLAQGKSLLAQEQYAHAMFLFEHATQLEPDNWEAWANLGVSQNLTKRWQEGMVSWERTLILNPNIAAIWNNKGAALNALRRYEEALVANEQALALDPKYISAWFGKGVSLNGLRRYEEALAAYERALELDPRDATIWNSKGNVLRRLQRYEEALTSYEQVLNLDPANVSAWSSKGAMLVRLTRYGEALVAYEEALSLDPKIASAWNNKGVSLYWLTRYVEALAAYEQALTVDSTNTAVWTNRGTTLSALGRYSEALADYEKGYPWQTSNADEFDAEDFRGLIQALRATGRTADAEAAEVRAKELGL